MIVAGSRYANQPVLTVPIDAAGHTNQAVFRLSPQRPATFQYYRVQIGERLDTIAYKVLGRPDLWWVIADANPEIVYPDNLVTGSIIRIPS